MQDAGGLGYGSLAGSEEGFLLVVERELDDALDTVAADDTRHADIDVAIAVLALEICGAGDHLTLIVDDAVYRYAALAPGAIHAEVPSRPVSVAPPTIVALTTSSNSSLVRKFEAGIPL